MQDNATRYNKMQYNKMQYNTAECYVTPHNAISPRIRQYSGEQENREQYSLYKLQRKTISSDNTVKAIWSQGEFPPTFTLMWYKLGWIWNVINEMLLHPQILDSYCLHSQSWAIGPFTHDFSTSYEDVKL